MKQLSSLLARGVSSPMLPRQKVHRRTVHSSMTKRLRQNVHRQNVQRQNVHKKNFLRQNVHCFRIMFLGQESVKYWNVTTIKINWTLTLLHDIVSQTLLQPVEGYCLWTLCREPFVCERLSWHVHHHGYILQKGRSSVPLQPHSQGYGTVTPITHCWEHRLSPWEHKSCRSWTWAYVVRLHSASGMDVTRVIATQSFERFALPRSAGVEILSYCSYLTACWRSVLMTLPVISEHVF